MQVGVILLWIPDSYYLISINIIFLLLCPLPLLNTCYIYLLFYIHILQENMDNLHLNHQAARPPPNYYQHWILMKYQHPEVVPHPQTILISCSQHMYLLEKNKTFHIRTLHWMKNVYQRTSKLKVFLFWLWWVVQWFFCYWHERIMGRLCLSINSDFSSLKLLQSRNFDDIYYWRFSLQAIRQI